jgi:hypothetical protein
MPYNYLIFDHPEAAAYGVALLPLGSVMMATPEEAKRNVTVAAENEPDELFCQ